MKQHYTAPRCQSVRLTAAYLLAASVQGSVDSESINDEGTEDMSRRASRHSLWDDETE